METILTNLTGKVRRETLDGREYLVAPFVSIVKDRVLNGSQGALLYPSDEVAKDVGVWNGMPITVGHPTDNGRNTSARSPKIVRQFKIGEVYNDSVTNGNRTGEGWFDVALTKKKSPAIYNALVNGQPMELSTGLFTDNVPATNSKTHDGQRYDFIARNYKPDHLAILPTQRGACSLRDGCGLLINEICENCGGEGGKPGPCAGEGSSVPERQGIGGTKSGRLKFAHETARNDLKIAKAALARATTDHETTKQMNAVQDASRRVQRTGRLLMDDPTSNEDKKSLWRKLGEALGITQPVANEEMTENGFCATGEGGGLDNSCGKESGGGGSGREKTFKEASSAAKEATSAVAKHESGLQKKHDDPEKMPAAELKKMADMHQAAADAHNEAYMKHGDNDSHKDLVVHEKAAKLHRTEAGSYRGWLKKSTNNSTEPEEPTMNRDDNIKYLTTNCSCWKGEDKTLAVMNDSTLTKLRKVAEDSAKDAVVANAVAETFGEEFTSLTVNAMPEFIKKKIAAKDGEGDPEDAADGADDEEAEGEVPVKNKKPTKNEEVKPMKDRLTPDELAVWNAAVEIEGSERTRLITQLTANVKDVAKKTSMTKKFNDRSKTTLNDLRDLVSLLPVPAPTRNQRTAPVQQTSYFGAQPAPVLTDNADDASDDLLEVPTINWAEASKSHRS